MIKITEANNNGPQHKTLTTGNYLESFTPRLKKLFDKCQDFVEQAYCMPIGDEKYVNDVEFHFNDFYLFLKNLGELTEQEQKALSDAAMNYLAPREDQPKSGTEFLNGIVDLFNNRIEKGDQYMGQKSILKGVVAPQLDILLATLRPGFVSHQYLYNLMWGISLLDNVRLKDNNSKSAIESGIKILEQFTKTSPRDEVFLKKNSVKVNKVSTILARIKKLNAKNDLDGISKEVLKLHKVFQPLILKLSELSIGYEYNTEKPLIYPSLQLEQSFEKEKPGLQIEYDDEGYCSAADLLAAEELKEEQEAARAKSDAKKQESTKANSKKAVKSWTAKRLATPGIAAVVIVSLMLANFYRLGDSNQPESKQTDVKAKVDSTKVQKQTVVKKTKEPEPSTGPNGEGKTIEKAKGLKTPRTKAALDLSKEGLKYVYNKEGKFIWLVAPSTKKDGKLYIVENASLPKNKLQFPEWSVIPINVGSYQDFLGHCNGLGYTVKGQANKTSVQEQKPQQRQPEVKVPRQEPKKTDTKNRDLEETLEKARRVRGPQGERLNLNARLEYFYSKDGKLKFIAAYAINSPSKRFVVENPNVKKQEIKGNEAIPLNFVDDKACREYMKDSFELDSSKSPR